MSLRKLAKKNFVAKYWKQLILLLILAVSVLVTRFAGSQIVKFFSRAAPIPANIVVDNSQSKGKLVKPWSGLSQGGETESNGALVSIAPVSSRVKTLGVKYIRIDHVFDRPYQSRIKEILDAGAIPMIALSYFPPDVANRDIGTVYNWDKWREKVRALIEDVSGRDKMNVSGVYYEVWNEPDGEGFGGFEIGRGKDYFILYQESVKAALSAQNVNDFKIGGPALADLRRCTNGTIFGCDKYWLDQFFNLISASKTRLDFISWHRYSTRMLDFNEDVNFITNLYTKYADMPPAEKIITEWGSVPERSSLHSSVADAAHLVAAARTFTGHVDLSTKFEVRDGPASGNDGWGILYYGGSPKPAYYALRILNMLRDNRILLSGEGTYVTGLASRDSSGTTMLLTNYDPSGTNLEQVPIKVTNLVPGKYRLTKHLLSSTSPSGKQSIQSLTTSKGTFETVELMTPNSVILLDFQLVGLLPQD